MESGGRLMEIMTLMLAEAANMGIVENFPI